MVATYLCVRQICCVSHWVVGLFGIRARLGKRFMASLTVYDQKGAEVGTYEIEPTDIAPRINKQLLHDAVVM